MNNNTLIFMFDFDHCLDPDHFTLIDNNLYASGPIIEHVCHAITTLAPDQVIFRSFSLRQSFNTERANCARFKSITSLQGIRAVANAVVGYLKQHLAKVYKDNAIQFFIDHGLMVDLIPWASWYGRKPVEYQPNGSKSYAPMMHEYLTNHPFPAIVDLSQLPTPLNIETVVAANKQDLLYALSHYYACRHDKDAFLHAFIYDDSTNILAALREPNFVKILPSHFSYSLFNYQSKKLRQSKQQPQMTEPEITAKFLFGRSSTKAKGETLNFLLNKDFLLYPTSQRCILVDNLPNDMITLDKIIAHHQQLADLLITKRSYTDVMRLQWLLEFLQFHSKQPAINFIASTQLAEKNTLYRPVSIYKKQLFDQTRYQ